MLTLQNACQQGVSAGQPCLHFARDPGGGGGTIIAIYMDIIRGQGRVAYRGPSPSKQLFAKLTKGMFIVEFDGINDAFLH
jgi:hypothetical protein